MASTLTTHTRWDGPALQVERGGTVLERIAVDRLRRVVLVCEGGDTPADLQFALLDLGDEHLLMPADNGIAKPVYFEHQAFWTGRSCIWWVTRPHAPLPREPVTGLALLHPERPPRLRLPATALAAWIETCPMEGPQTWEQRRWSRGTRHAHG